MFEFNTRSKETTDLWLEFVKSRKKDLYEDILQIVDYLKQKCGQEIEYLVLNVNYDYDFISNFSIFDSDKQEIVLSKEVKDEVRYEIFSRDVGEFREALVSEDLTEKMISVSFIRQELQELDKLRIARVPHCDELNEALLWLGRSGFTEVVWDDTGFAVYVANRWIDLSEEDIEKIESFIDREDERGNTEYKATFILRDGLEIFVEW